MRYKINRYLVITSLFFAGFISAQDTPSILITTSSETQVPADAIFFSITLNTQNDDPKKAFDEHKNLEKSLLNLFKEFEIADSNISYSLLYIGKTPPYSKDKPGFQTRQVVSIRVSDFSQYEPLQLAFLANGIYEYNAKFTTEGKEEWVEIGIKKAISKATEEAELTAKNLGKKLGEIITIESSHYYPSGDNITALTMQRPGESLIELPRFVRMSVSLRVKFELLDD